MAARGLVERSPSTIDRRATDAQLTDTGFEGIGRSRDLPVVGPRDDVAADRLNGGNGLVLLPFRRTGRVADP